MAPSLLHEWCISRSVWRKSCLVTRRRTIPSVAAPPQCIRSANLPPDHRDDRSVQNQAGGTKQGIHSPFERANHGPMRRRSISQRREPASHWPPALRIMLSNSRGQRSVTQLPSVPNSTGPIRGGTGQGARMVRFCARSQRGATTYEAATNSRAISANHRQCSCRASPGCDLPHSARVLRESRSGIDRGSADSARSLAERWRQRCATWVGTTWRIAWRRLLLPRLRAAAYRWPGI